MKIFRTSTGFSPGVCGITLLLGMILAGAGVAAGVDMSVEHRIKAALLYRISKFTKWPEEAFSASSDPLKICMFGAESMTIAMHSISGKRVRGRTVKVEYFRRVVDVLNNQCHLIYINKLGTGRFSELMRQLGNQPMLTVSDISQFARTGGAVGLLKGEARAKFEINLRVVERANLKMSAQLLGLSTVIRE